MMNNLQPLHRYVLTLGPYCESKPTCDVLIQYIYDFLLFMRCQFECLFASLLALFHYSFQNSFTAIVYQVTFVLGTELSHKESLLYHVSEFKILA